MLAWGGGHLDLVERCEAEIFSPEGVNRSLTSGLSGPDTWCEPLRWRVPRFHMSGPPDRQMWWKAQMLSRGSSFSVLRPQQHRGWI